jgi:hypothetical protein
VPTVAGKCVLKATAKPDDGKIEPTLSRRWVAVE